MGNFYSFSLFHFKFRKQKRRIIYTRKIKSICSTLNPFETLRITRKKLFAENESIFSFVLFSCRRKKKRKLFLVCILLFHRFTECIPRSNSIEYGIMATQRKRKERKNVECRWRQALDGSDSEIAAFIINCLC